MRKKLQKENLTESFVRVFCEVIISGGLDPGDYIPSEAKIAEEYGVSRSVVREGVRELTTLGLIDKHQGRQSKISPKNEWDLLNPNLLAIYINYSEQKKQLLEDLFAVRMLVECQAAADAAIRRSDMHLEKMNKLLLKMENAIKEPEKFLRLDFDFHAEIHRASNNLIVKSILSLLSELLRTSRSFTMQPPKELMGSLKQHQKCYQAIKAQDPAEARIAMNEHLAWSRSVISFD